MVQIKNNINTALLSASMALVIMAAVQTIMLYLGRVTEIPPFLKLSVPSVLGMIFPMLIKRSCMRVTYRKARKLYTAAAICFGVGSCTGLNFLFSLFRLYFSGSSPASSSLSFSSPLDAALTITAAAIVPAVFEELLFRGTIIPVLGICGKRFSIVVSALLFAMIHNGIYNIAFAFIAGVLMGIVRTITGKLLPCIIVHMINNLLAVAVLYTGQVFSDDMGNQIFYITGISGLILAAASLPFILLLRKGKSRPSDRSALSCLFSSPMFYIFILSAVIMQII